MWVVGLYKHLIPKRQRVILCNVLEGSIHIIDSILTISCSSNSNEYWIEDSVFKRTGLNQSLEVGEHLINLTVESIYAHIA